MTAEVAADPGRPERTLTPASPSSAAATRVRELFSHPSRVAAFLWSMGAGAVASALVVRHWPGPSLVALVTALALAASCALVRATVSGRLPCWSLQVDVGLANLLVSVVAWAGAARHVDLANLYLLAEVFALLYLPLRSALGHLAAAGAAYAVVLWLGPRPAEPPTIAWLSVFASAVVVGVVMVGLVSVLHGVAREDPLTGLANRRAWDERLDAEIERAQRSGEVLSVVVVDLDGFKAVNDARGHQAGDRLLQATAASWRDATRGGGDLLARLGGDEFGLLASGADDVAAHGLARRLVEVLPHGVSGSVGVATWDRAEGASDLVRRADRAMYRAKRRRRRSQGTDRA